MTITAITDPDPQRWHCPLCHLRYISPLPLAHPPNHNCVSKGRPMRNRKMELEDGQ